MDDKNKKMIRKTGIVLLVYILIMLSFWFLTGQQLSHRDSTIQRKTVNGNVGELWEGRSVQQEFRAPADSIYAINLYFSDYFRSNTGVVQIYLHDRDSGDTLAHIEIDCEKLSQDESINILFEDEIQGVSGEILVLNIFSNSVPGNAVTLYTDNTNVDNELLLRVDGQVQPGTLTMEISGTSSVPFARNYFIFASILGLLLLAYLIILIIREQTGRVSQGIIIMRTFQRYSFLLHELVQRDFKTKYKRSVLGVFWSFLNPLLTMVVQYIIFSTIFKQNINNFPVYLLTGVVFFNFFSEACGLGIGAIVDNSSLLTKVYIPKYIFPASRVLSSTINLLLSFVPLLIVVLLTGVPLRPQILLLAFPALCVIIFCMGMVLLLSAIMVFFRDTRFIWSVVSMLWMYATPIFYPENIIPEPFGLLIKINPLYHFIRFSRTVLIEGISPLPQAYLFCFIAAVLPLLFGTFVFRKTQNKFSLYI